MATIVDSLRNLVTPDLLARMSSLMGESEGGVSRALGAAFPTILAAMMNRSGDGGVMRQIMDLLNDRSIDPGIARNPASLLAGGGLARSPATDIGGRLLSTLFGSQTSGVTNALADHAGIKGTSASTILGLAAPLVLSALSDRVRNEGLNASGLAGLLSSERDGIARSVPGGLAALVGFGATRASAPIPDAYSALGPARRSNAWLGAAVAGVIAIAGLWALTRGRTAEEVASVPSQPPRLAVAIVKPEDAGSFSRRLPNDFELTAPAIGIERQIVVFVEDAGKSVDSVTWFNFDRLLFETGSATLKPESKTQLKNVAEIMKAYPNVKARIGGYTDNVGDPTSNLKLSQDRAAAVVRELVALGVASDRLTAEGYGEQYPVADNSTEEGRQQNRRIAMRVTQK
jgi:OOP family OmpA-OmpF porin